MHYDVIIVGLGAMGSATSYQLTKRGAKVLGIDQFHPPHQLGSSHGESRITRRAIGEGPAYIPLIKRAYQIWEELEQASGNELLHPCDGYIIGPTTGSSEFHGYDNFIKATAGLAKQYELDHKVLASSDLQKQLPMLKIQDDEIAYFEPQSGVLSSEKCIATQLQLAKKQGATLQTDERVIEFSYDQHGVTVTTDKGQYTGDKLVLSAGAWMTQFVPKLKQNDVKIYRQAIFWFEAEDITQYTPEKFPWVIWTGQNADDMMAIFPTTPDGTRGVKVLTEQFEEATTAETINRTVGPEEVETMYQKHVERRLYGLTNNCLKSAVCMYTNTTDGNFVIDFHPDSERVIVASPCTGHGFKHSATIGEILSQLALDGCSPYDISSFSLARFQ